MQPFVKVVQTSTYETKSQSPYGAKPSATRGSSKIVVFPEVFRYKSPYGAKRFATIEVALEKYRGA
jgi:hypothetical protein